ncbi:MAG: glycoside hydrolase family 16 protein [Flavobacteriales bacterium]|nr:glycoside hydrolase family 16 protein [Flavobacteriales bacterium]
MHPNGTSAHHKLLHRVPRFLFITALLSAPFSAFAQRKNIGPIEFHAGGPCDTTAWKLVFHDEFDGTELDRSKWVTYFTYSDDGSDRCSGCRYTSGTNSTLRDEHVKIGDGMLTLEVVARTNTWYDVTVEHEAGLIHSIGEAKFNYGRFEIRCQIPAHPGLWSAFWGFGGETEIDVFEFCGEKPRWMKSSLHRWGTRRASNTGKHKAQDLSKALHDYAVEWEPDQIRFYLDGQLVHARSRLLDERGKDLSPCDRQAGTHATATFFPKEGDAVNIIASLGVSRANDYCKGPKKPMPWPAGSSMVVDHIRVYQRSPQQGLHDLCDSPRTLNFETGPAIRSGESTRVYLKGPHGALHWSTAPGLEIAERDEHGILVRATGERNGLLWVRVESVNDPCPRGDLKLETGVEVR